MLLIKVSDCITSKPVIAIIELVRKNHEVTLRYRDGS